MDFIQLFTTLHTLRKIIPFVALLTRAFCKITDLKIEPVIKHIFFGWIFQNILFSRGAKTLRVLGERWTSNNDVARAAQALAPRAAPQPILKSNKKTNTQYRTLSSYFCFFIFFNSMFDVGRSIFDVHLFFSFLCSSVRMHTIWVPTLEHGNQAIPQSLNPSIPQSLNPSILILLP